MVVFNNVAEGINHSRLAAYDWSWIDFLAKANRFYGAVLGKEVRTLGEVELVQGDFRIDDWLIPPQINSVEKEGKTWHLEPKVMQVLLHLALAHAEEREGRQKSERWTLSFDQKSLATLQVIEIKAGISSGNLGVL